MSDWITKFMEYTDGIPSPDIFRQWSAISAVAGALERRVFVETGRSLLYPNMFIVLVAPPGVGKSQAISQTYFLWQELKDLHLAPDNVTKASLIDTLMSSRRNIILNGGQDLLDYHSLLVAASELGVLLPSHDLEFLSVLNHVYDNPKCYRENRRTNKLAIDISYPQINILAGTQPGYLATLMPEEAWSMGFTSRIIMIYAPTSPRVPLFGVFDKRSPRQLINGLLDMTNLCGQFAFTDDAKKRIEDWNLTGCPPMPDHSKLQHYNPRRIIHVLKLAMVAAVSETMSLIITLDHINRAIDWLLEAEQLMPDIFRDMVGKSDSQVISDLHFFLWKLHSKSKQEIHEARIINFLKERVPAQKVVQIMQIAERSNIIARVAGSDSLYVPRPRHEHGIE